MMHKIVAMLIELAGAAVGTYMTCRPEYFRDERLRMYSKYPSTRRHDPSAPFVNDPAYLTLWRVMGLMFLLFSIYMIYGLFVNTGAESPMQKTQPDSTYNAVAPNPTSSF